MYDLVAKAVAQLERPRGEKSPEVPPAAAAAPQEKLPEEKSPATTPAAPPPVAAPAKSAPMSSENT
jgi:hypothetical protein